jgi:hypothetical protein
VEGGGTGPVEVVRDPGPGRQLPCGTGPRRASVPVARLTDPAVLRAALDALAVRLDGHRAAANTIARKRAVFHNALGYAVGTGLLDANPADQVSWRPPKASGAVNRSS